MKTFKLLPTIAATSIVAALSINAYAVPQEGTIGFSSVVGYGFSLDTDADLFSIDAGLNAQVDNLSGEFSDWFTVGSFAEFSSFNYDSGFVSPSTIWTAISDVGSNSGTEVEFALESILSVTDETIINGAVTTSYAVIVGQGSIFTDSESVSSLFTMTINTTEMGSSGSFTWSSSQSAAPASAPASAALLGLGLAGLALGRRRARKS